jgi:hypothetical protein
MEACSPSCLSYGGDARAAFDCSHLSFVNLSSIANQVLKQDILATVLSGVCVL